jgi:hypothetical protein
MNNETVKCDACGEAHLVSISGANTIDSGWLVPYEAFGYYGGFTDNLDWLMANTEPKSWNICHACIVKLLDIFPLLAKSLDKGAHPSPYDDKPCCDYAWSFTNEGETVFASGGEWISAPEKNRD